jgi:hypothetical protein
MGRSQTILSALGLGLCGLAGCGGPSSVNFFDLGVSAPGGSAAIAGASGTAGAGEVAGAASAGSTVASGGAPALAGAGGSAVAGAGTPSTATGGTSALDAAGAANAGGAAGAQNELPCSPAVDITKKPNKASGDFKTTGPVCLLITDDIVGWGCANFQGRTVKVNGVQVHCAQLPLPDKVNDGYYFDISAGAQDYANMYWY